MFVGAPWDWGGARADFRPLAAALRPRGVALAMFGGDVGVPEFERRVAAWSATLPPAARGVAVFLSDCSGAIRVPPRVVLLRTSLEAASAALPWEGLLPVCWLQPRAAPLPLPPPAPESRAQRPRVSFCGAMGSHPDRAAWIRALRTSPLVDAVVAERGGFWGGGRVGSPEAAAAFESNMAAAEFAACPRGVGNFSLRFYEALRNGRVPVVLRNTPLPADVDWTDVVVMADDAADVPRAVAAFWARRGGTAEAFSPTLWGCHALYGQQIALAGSGGVAALERASCRLLASDAQFDAAAAAASAHLIAPPPSSLLGALPAEQSAAGTPAASPATTLVTALFDIGRAANDDVTIDECIEALRALAAASCAPLVIFLDADVAAARGGELLAARPRGAKTTIFSLPWADVPRAAADAPRVRAAFSTAWRRDSTMDFVNSRYAALGAARFALVKHAAAAAGAAATPVYAWVDARALRASRLLGLQPRGAPLKAALPRAAAVGDALLVFKSPMYAQAGGHVVSDAYGCGGGGAVLTLMLGTPPAWSAAAARVEAAWDAALDAGRVVTARHAVAILAANGAPELAAIAPAECAAAAGAAAGAAVETGRLDPAALAVHALFDLA